MKKNLLICGVLILLLGIFLHVPKKQEISIDIPGIGNDSIATPNDEQPRDSVARVHTGDESGTDTPFQTNNSDLVGQAPRFSTVPKKYKMVTINNKEYPLRIYQPLMIPNDPNANQWWAINTKANLAWDTPRGQNETLLAVIDTGFALAHEEFTGRWDTNSGESGPAGVEGGSSRNCTDRALPLSASCNLIDDDRDGTIDNETGSAIYQNPSRLNCTDQGKPLAKDCNRVDDDGNGYVDDLRGWDFINNDNSVQAGELNPNGGGTRHGTQVAALAAANGGNGKGIAGVDWGTKILPIQALDDDGYGDTLSVGQAILYAADRGANVISLSLGSELPDDFVQEAVQAAIASGSVVVAASGNDGCNCMVYPAQYPEVVAVGALNTDGNRVSFSSWGQNIDIMAPGVNMTSASWAAANPSSAYSSGINGTSFATPVVSGLITRLLSHQPDATPLQLIAALTENVNRMGLPATTPHDMKIGFGSLDAQKATARMTSPSHQTQLYAFGPVQKGSFLNPSSPLESGGNFLIHQCGPSTVGATAMYELAKGGVRFFSISKVERDRALGLGYSSTAAGYVCLQQPHDTAELIRSIDIFQEIRNVFRPI